VRGRAAGARGHPGYPDRPATASCGPSRPTCGPRWTTRSPRPAISGRRPGWRTHSRCTGRWPAPRVRAGSGWAECCRCSGARLGSARWH
jgi:hypothetical protein